MAKTFRAPTQAEPLFFHTTAQKNIPVGSFNSKRLKSKKPICSKCNNETTQPFDLSWAKLSKALQDRLSSSPKLDYVRANRIFKYDTRRRLLNVHLFWVKSFGCFINDEEIQIDLKPFSEAILKKRHHPEIYLNFFRNSQAEKMLFAGRSDMEVIKNVKDEILGAKVSFQIGQLEILLSYLKGGLKDDALKNPWHPRLGTSKLYFQNGSE